MPLKGKPLALVRIQAQALHRTFPDETPRNIAKMILAGRDPPQVTLNSLRNICAKAMKHHDETGEWGGDKRKGNSGAPRTVRTPTFVRKIKRSAKGQRGKSTRKFGKLGRRNTVPGLCSLVESLCMALFPKKNQSSWKNFWENTNGKEKTKKP